MKLQILGTGCAKCKTLAENTRKAVNEMGLDAEIEKVEDLRQIVQFGVMLTPALAVDGDVKIVGRVPSPEEIKRLLA
jgi:small redox-active disulfide protein 2